jgi:UDP-N-acetylglucosamine/UDP-N-acetylgalactosamine 4-epimerase
MISSKKFNPNLEKLIKKRKYTWLITGVAGFIGSNILEKLLHYDQKVVGIDNFSTGFKKNLKSVELNVGSKRWKRFQFIKGDISNLKICNKVIKNIDIVLHQAARGSIPKSTKNPIGTNNDNITGFLNILNCSKENNVQSFVYASSSSVYGDSKKLPKVEKVTGKILSNYALTKKVNEEYARLFYELYGFKTVGLRYFNVFGKRQNPNGDYAAVIPKWINNALTKKKITINGDGKTSRDFCPISNVVQANILAGMINLKNKNYVFNVGTGSRINLKRLSETIYAILEIKKSNQKISYKKFRKGDIKHSLSSIKNIKYFMGYRPSVSFKEGIEHTINWFKLNDC